MTLTTQHGSPAHVQITRLTAIDPAMADALAELLIACVGSGASVSFMHPLSVAKATAFWHTVARSVAAGDRVLLVAYDGTELLGTVQLLLDQPENQPHRAEIAKMLVHVGARRRGVGSLLMNAAEAAARAAGKTLLVLDTASPDAERLYGRCGWQLCGCIPDYALNPHGGLAATAVFYKRIAPPDSLPSEP